MNYDQNNNQRFPFITSLFSDTYKHTKIKPKVGDVVGCIFEVESSLGRFLILKQIYTYLDCIKIVKLIIAQDIPDDPKKNLKGNL
jgi:hypothetical protein